MSSYWVNFARTGDPNGRNLPRWPTYDEQRDALLVLGDRIETRPVPRKAELDFLESLVK